MTTHQEDFHRMCLSGWLVGRFGIKSWVECGVLEGETVGYFSQLVPGGRGMGCDIDGGPVEVAKKRYPHLDLQNVNAVEWLRGLDAPLPALFYLDTVWVVDRRFHAQMAIIKMRWPREIVFVNNVELPGHWMGHRMTPVAELARYGRVIVPTYSMAQPVAGYGVIVPDDAELPPLRHWKILPKQE